MDLFVLFSSSSSVFGVDRPGHLCIEQCFLDALASYRRTQGLPALSIGWGLWAGKEDGHGGPAPRDEAFGMGAMSTAQALSAMERLIGASTTQRVVVRMDWAHMGAAARKGAQAAPAFWTGCGPPRKWPRLRLYPRRGAGAACRPRRRARRCCELVRSVVAGVLGFFEPERAGRRAGVQRAGPRLADGGADPQPPAGRPGRGAVARRWPSTIRRWSGWSRICSPTCWIWRTARRAEAPGRPMADEPIAIVGAACRLPWRGRGSGGVLAAAGRRGGGHHRGAGRALGAADWYDPDPEARGRTYVTRGGFLREVDSVAMRPSSASRPGRR